MVSTQMFPEQMFCDFLCCCLDLHRTKHTKEGSILTFFFSVSSGFLLHGDFALLHPHRPVGHPMEILLEVSSLQSRTRTIGGEGFGFPLCSEQHLDRPTLRWWRTVEAGAGTETLQLLRQQTDCVSTDAVNTDVDKMMWDNNPAHLKRIENTWRSTQMLYCKVSTRSTNTAMLIVKL